MSEYLVINQKKLRETSIKISGYRHSSNLLLSAAVLAPDTTIKLHNVPHLLDTRVMLQLLQKLGAECLYFPEKNEVTIDTKMLHSYDVPNELSKQTHGSLYLLPVLLARFGKCIFGKSGGCQIGKKTEGFERPVDHILDVMKQFGAHVQDRNEYITVESDELCATTIDIMKYSQEKNAVIGPLTSGATKTAILLALSIHKGKTTILNPFLKSESIDLLSFIRTLGYEVYYDSEKITIEKGKIQNEIEHTLISDPSEVVTYMSLAGFHDVQLNLTGITINRTWPILKPELDLLTKIGLTHAIVDNVVIVKRTHELLSFSVEITVKDICTDHHPLLIALMLKGKGDSKLTEHVWHDRFNYVEQVKKFGLRLEQYKNTVVVQPSKVCTPTEAIDCPDLRAAALLVILALDAPGKTLLRNYHHLERGYVDFIKNLDKMGASIEMISSA